MAAEEARNPRRDIPLAYISGILTLVALAFGTMIFAGAVGDWRQLADINDPLPQAMKIVVGGDSGWLHMMVWIGLFGLIASLHGIIMGYSRQIFALSRAGFLPAVLATLHPGRKTPHWAILSGGAIGIAALYCDDWLSFDGHPLTANIVTLSVFGAIVMYIMSMMSLFRLRRREPHLPRPFRAPLYPLLPLLALGLATLALIAMIVTNLAMFGLFLVLFALFALLYRLKAGHRAGLAADPVLNLPPA
jgi:ethanolamine permease